MSDRSVRWCFRFAWLVVVLLSQSNARAQAAAPASYYWLEGEAAAGISAPENGVRQIVSIAGTAHSEWLSGGKWLMVSIEADKVAAQLPDGGMVLTYPFVTKAPGRYDVWNRIGFEFVRSPFDWRVDDGEWRRISPSELTTDCMELSFWTEVAWLKMGDVNLPAGAHKLEIRLPKLKNKDGTFERVLYASDALCVCQGKFHPYSKFKPGEDYRTDQDRQAAEHVFALPAPANPQDRVALPLKGLWEVCRNDEPLPGPDIAVPIRDIPQQPAWTAIEVPGDRNTLRPDLLLAHRLWYRTQVRVPAAYAGRSFVLTFPQNNLNTTVCVNGVLCGFEKNPFVRFDIDITKGIRPGQTNEIWVGIRDAWYGYTNDPKDPMKLRRVFNLPPNFFGQGFQRLAYPIWNHPQSGILLTPQLTAEGPVRAADVFVRPSVTHQRLDVDVTVANTTDYAASGEVVCEAIDAAGRVAKTLPPAPFALDAGKRRVLTVSGAWADPQLWWPDAPTMYTLRTTIRVADRPADIDNTPFGFREWSWQGHDFKLNGVVWHGWADCFTAPNPEAWIKFYRDRHETTMRFWGADWMGLSPDQALDFFDKNGVVVRRSGLLDGEAIGYMAVEENPVFKELYHSDVKMDLLNNWKDQVVAQVKGERNHPSVMLWSIENEWLFINCINLYGGLMDQFEKVATEVSNAVIKADPTRPTMSDGGGACKDDTLPVHGNHYVAGDWPKWPAIAYEANPTGGGRGRWVWDQKRPRFIGEDLFIAGNHPDFSTFGGDAAFTGKTGSLPAAGLLISMAQQGYRWANYGAWQFWMGQRDADGAQYTYFAPRVALVKEWDWTFGSGQSARRTIAILNDTYDAGPITFTWTLTVGGQKAGGDSTVYTIAPGERKIVDVTLQMPQVAQRTEGTFDLTLAVDGKTMWQDSKVVSVLDTALTTKPAGLAALNAQTLAVYDPNHSVAAFLSAHQIAFHELKSLNALAPAPSGIRVLLIGRDALTRAQATSSALAAWAAPGRSVVVLEQTNPLEHQGLPCTMDPAQNEGRVGFIEDDAHPVVAGLQNKDFFTWGQDQMLYHDAYLKPARGAKSLLQCHDSLQNTALVEAPAGQGLLLLTQLQIGGKLGTEATAQKLLENMLDYAAVYKQVFRPASICAGNNAGLAKAVAGMDLDATTAQGPLQALARPGGVAVIDAGPNNLQALAANLDAVHKFVQSGGWIVFNNLTPAGLADFNKLVGVEHMIRPFGSTRPTLTKDGPMAIERLLFSVPRNPLTAGLTAPDVALYSSQRIFPYAEGDYTLPDEFTYVVDIDDVAPFAASDFAHFGNIVNGFTTADGWPLIINFPAPDDNTPYDINLTLPAPQTLTELTWQQNLNYWATPKVGLIVDGDRGRMQTFDLAANGDPQTFALNPPLTGRKVTFELAPPVPEPGKPRNYGIDNIWLKARRSVEFYKLVKPMLNIGALVEYPRGAGGFVLCNVNYNAPNDLPANALKKRNMLAAILRNLKAPFTGGKTVIAGADLAYTPVDLAKYANQFRDRKGWFGDPRHTFADLPVGAQKFAGVNYDVYSFKTSPVPEAIMLGGGGVPGNLPPQVKGIAVNRKTDALFFLQAARVDRGPQRQHGQEPLHYFELARYMVHYADGQTAEIPVLADQDVANYVQQNQPRDITGAQVAWTKPYGDGRLAVAYSMQWNNPRPGVGITSIDLLPGRDQAGVPVLLALTAASAR